MVEASSETSGSGVSVGNVGILDVAVIVAYFGTVMGFGIWSSLKNRGSIKGYFMAGRDMNFILIGASLFASNIGSGHFIGLAGSGAASGIGITVFELNGIFTLLLLGWVFIPAYISSGVYTMPEYLRLRFGGQRIRVYLAVLALLLSIFTKVAADLFAGAIFINQAFNWNIYAAIVLLLAIAALFTIAGGLTAVIWTDFIQTIIMLAGAVYLMLVSLIEVGGYESLKALFPLSVASLTTDAHNQSLNLTLQGEGCKPKPPPSTAFNLIRPLDDPLPWPGVFFGLTISATWYWCTDQVIVQRALASKNFSHAKAGCILAGYLKFLPMWLLVIPGMISRVLYPDDIACVDPVRCLEICQTPTGCTNIAYPLLVIRLLPSGARGLMLAVMMSALMSSLTSIFNSSSTIFTIDIWTRFRREPSDVELMIVSRVFVLFMVAVGIAWIPIIQSSSELFHYIQSVTSYLAPPICAVYVLAVLWKRTNEQGAFWGLMIGLAVGVVRFVWESVYKSGGVACGVEEESVDWRVPSIISEVHYLHFGIILFIIVLISTVVISLMTPPIPDEFLVRLTFWDRYSEAERMDISLLDKKSAASSSQGPDTNHTSKGNVNTSYSTDDSDGIVRHSPDDSSHRDVNNSNSDSTHRVTFKLDEPKERSRCHLHNNTDATASKYNTQTQNIHRAAIDAGEWKDRVGIVAPLTGSSVVDDEKKKQHPCMFAIRWLCGIEGAGEEEPQVELSEEEQRELEQRMKEQELAQRSLAEGTTNRILCSVNAVILLTAAVFVWAFFA